jgi:hypothetical protein
MQEYVSKLLQDHPVAVNEVALSKLLQNVPSGDVIVKP